MRIDLKSHSATINVCQPSCQGLILHPSNLPSSGRLVNDWEVANGFVGAFTRNNEGRSVDNAMMLDLVTRVRGAILVMFVRAYDVESL